MSKRKRQTVSKPKDSSPDRKTGGSTRGSARREVWLYGVHAVLAALANGERRCKRLVLTEEARASVEKKLSKIKALQGIVPEVMLKQAIGSLLPLGAVHQGIALLADPLPAFSLNALLDSTKEKAGAVVVLLDQVTDPQNVGAVLRSAAGFGAEAVLLPNRHAPATTGTLAKAASGALESVPLIHVPNLARAMDALKEADFWCVGLDADAKTSLQDLEMRGRTALILGAEGKGLRRLTRDYCDFLARLPIHREAIESLNVAAAAAVALYELAGR
jgi:23S rRNA (guanosine2251-2'-O)-methyltransferase